MGREQTGATQGYTRTYGLQDAKEFACHRFQCIHGLSTKRASPRGVKVLSKSAHMRTGRNSIDVALGVCVKHVHLSKAWIAIIGHQRSYQVSDASVDDVGWESALRHLTSDDLLAC